MASAVYTELKDAVKGQVVVRFPPEASGFLHIGHAKAALLNYHYKTIYDGKFIMRFDDTNPEKEKEDYEEAILNDVRSLGIKWDHFSYTSDHFDLLIEKCTEMIKKGQAYVDNTPPEQMKLEREKRLESKCRQQSVEDNLRKWQEMISGSEEGQKCCVRAKLDFESKNGCLRDPTMYRCKNEPHPRHGNKYKVYPTYDFACPVVDSVEGVTHALRTTEYLDRDPQYFWFIETLGLRKPVIAAYSRLNMMNTILSKRKLTWLVEEKYVDGWDDPRMPTVQGILRHGLTVEGLKQFIIAQGSSKSIVFMEWDKIWAHNKKYLEPIVPRYTAIDVKDSVTVLVDGYDGRMEIDMAFHKKNPELGGRKVKVHNEFLIEQADASLMNEGDTATFMDLGNLKINKITKNENGIVVNINASLDLENKDYKKTLKLTWLNKNSVQTASLVYYDHIITKSVLDKDDDFKDFVNKSSKVVVPVHIDPDVVSIEARKIIQFQRKGNFICDLPYDQATKTIVFNYIPDGTSKNPYSTVVSSSGKKPVPKEANVAANPAKSAEALKKQQEKAEAKAKKKEAHAAKASSGGDKQQSSSKQTKLGVAAKKEDNFADWYTEVITRSEMVEYYDVSGCYILRPWSYKIWERIQRFLDDRLQSWDDPRMPTVQGILRHGLTVEGLKQFIIAQGSSKSIVFMEWDKIWAHNKKYLEPIVPRYTAIDVKDSVTVLVDGYDGRMEIDMAFHKKNPELGGRKVKVHNEFLIEQADASLMNEGDTATFMDLGNLKINKITKNENGIVVNINASLDLENKDYKKTLKLTWLNKNSVQTASLVYYDHIITKSVLDKDDDFKDFVNKSSKVVVPVHIDPDVVSIEARKIIQFQRKGNFICDLPYDQATKTIVFNYIPDGTSKNPYSTVVSSSGKKPVPKEANVAANPAKSAEALKKQQEKAEAKAKKKEAHAAKASSGGDKQQSSSKQTKLGVAAKKEDNFADWYTEVITRSEMVEYYDVSGCYILRPWSYKIWERIQRFLDDRLQSIDVENCYFPIFVSQSALEKEKNHIADFAPEVAWVTRSGKSELAEPIAIRPTSETVMYPAFAKWVQSHRDLPIRLNQWNNVVRWEFKDPTPFIRTREFLWQEGHTAFATLDEATQEVDQILEFYAAVYEDLLAIPVVRGRKSEKEKFPGADFTLTVEGYIGVNGRGIQAATSHHLGQNFSKMFDISFQDPKDSSKRQFAYQNSWGLSTRTVGVLIMTHGDNKGLVLPPRVSPLQVVVIPVGITVSTKPEVRDSLLEACQKLRDEFVAANIRTKLDSTDHNTPGWKFNHYEVKGVCVRVELGPKDLEKSQFVACRRDTGEKLSLSLDGAAKSITELLETIQSSLYARAKQVMDDHQVEVVDWKEFLTKLNQKFTLVAPFCGRPDCEDNIKRDSVREATDALSGPLMGAKSLCIPKRQPTRELASKCIHPDCTAQPKYWTLFGRSY